MMMMMYTPERHLPTSGQHGPAPRISLLFRVCKYSVFRVKPPAPPPPPPRYPCKYHIYGIIYKGLTP